ncbi:DMT family transporter [Azorhizobium doebereinerae]|uniref:DMT family transporter n=1 Tax=Azorhizobium doebereinerae TaxID=281091 RepID=UPI00041B2E63|nr:DMT family transporter [Azorhizobium doebereinerae]
MSTAKLTTTPAATAQPFGTTPLLIALFCVLWSSAFAAGKVALVDCPPLLLLTLRFLFAGGLILGACALTGALKRLSGRDWASLILAGILNNAVYLGLSFTGMTMVSSGFTAVIISANPLLTALVAGPVLGERLTLRKLGGLLLGMAGVAIVLRSRLAGGHEGLTGTLFILGALVALTSGTLVYKRLRTSSGLWQASGIQCLAGGIALLPVALATESVSAIHVTQPFLWAFAYLVVGVSVGGYSLWYFILGRSTATEATALHFLMPPLGLFFGWALLGEHVPPLDFLGVAPIAAGIWLVTRERR